MKSLTFLVAVAVTSAVVLPPSELASIECDMCEMAVKTAVNKECKALLHKIPFATQKCQKFIDTDLNKIIKELESGTAPSDVCKKIDMC
ncbi:unnamed protein product [Nippostrongylus brasiliensis]|uniref:Saposin B-type domain-containing protein n=1 Tax=Nippostrongylus brasiliensis TaxID=27835 RepID=A0A158R2V8_NIPBR|nr:unnamed protein product [Nippostrongylus brasiliensis]